MYLPLLQSRFSALTWLSRFGAGLAVALLIALAAVVFRQLSGIQLASPLLLSVLVGMGIALWRAPSAAMKPGLAFAARPILRLGIVLLGFQLTFAQIAQLGLGAFGVAFGTLFATFFATRAMGRTLGVSAPLTDLLAAGTSVCGASAVAAANSVTRAEEADVAYAIASVTLFGTVLMLALPPLAGVIGLEGQGAGVWVGAAIHEVAQVTAAAFQLGEEAGQAGTVTKLIRVMLLAPLVLVMMGLARRQKGNAGQGRAPMPWFVFGFLGVIALNSFLPVAPVVRQVASQMTTLCLATGLAAMGLQISLGAIKARGWRPLALAGFACVLVAVISGALTMMVGL